MYFGTKLLACTLKETFAKVHTSGRSLTGLEKGKLFPLRRRNALTVSSGAFLVGEQLYSERNTTICTRAAIHGRSMVACDHANKNGRITHEILVEKISRTFWCLVR